MRVNNIEITEDTILATRMHFADIHRACIADALTGETRVNNPKTYIEWEMKRIEQCMRGEFDHTLTYLQAALWIQTGDCIAILS
jgi:hypothetical protein